MIGTLTLLGTGSSMGVPMIGCGCPVCQSKEPKNTRLRCSSFIQYSDKKILIDCGPDFHHQGLNHQIKHLDGVIFTHSHFDHVAGLDELRLFNFKTQKPLPCLCSEATYQDLYQRFHYIFKPRGKNGNFTVQFDFQKLPHTRGSLSFEGLPLSYFTYSQGYTEVNGFRLGDLAYVSDIKLYPDSIFEDLKGLKTLVLSALRYRDSHVHFNIQEACDFAKKVGASQCYFIHMDHEIDYTIVNPSLPKGTALGYDGLCLDFSFA